MDGHLSRDLLIQWLRDACVPRERFRVGVEWEKEPVHRDGRRLGFFERGGIQDILRALAAQHGWEPVYEGPHLIALERATATVTLEPGGQLEISTAPHARLADIERELRKHLAELQDVTRSSDALFLQTAFTPLQPVRDIAFVPKSRYDVMAVYLADRGRLAHSMMKGTTSVQATFDFSSEDDCARKFRVAMALSPVVTALAADSPLVEGQAKGVMSWRARCWRATDPARTGLLESLQSGFSFGAYVDWVLRVPMMFVYRDGRHTPASGVTFGDWLDRGGFGRAPDWADWEMHLTSVFPEVRLKKFLELRGADNGPLPQVLGIAALWKGLFYDDDALAAAEQVAGRIPLEQHSDLLDVAIEQGLEGRWEGRSLRAWAGLLLEIASAGLSRQAPDGPAEVAYLAALQDLATQGRSPAARVLELWNAKRDPRSFLAAVAYPSVSDIPWIAPSAAR
jgi:glutamate--cysteine ligase